MTVEERIKNRKIGIVGMARSGMATARLVQALHGIPFVSDNATAAKVSDQTSELRNLGIEFETGGHTDRVLQQDFLVVSPGVPLNLPILVKVRERGIPIFSEIEVASWVCPGTIVAITGSNGKTTTTTLTGEILSAAGFDTHVCGNIGRPLADIVHLMNPKSVAVLEVSSFQLETILEFRPKVATILNLTPDHIDRHGSFEAYKKAKYRITENQGADDVFILNGEDDESMADPVVSGARRELFTTRSDVDAAAHVVDGKLYVRSKGQRAEVIAVKDIAIKGPHNLQNSAAAVAMAVQLGVTPEVMARVLASFPGVEHRLENAGSVAGVTFINDSKATNVDSVRWALRSMITPVYLILGGRDKAGDFRPLIEEGRGKVKAIVAIGEAREKIKGVVGNDYRTEFAESMVAAVERCFEMAHPGETVLLSPGCASFDMFDNFEHRGRVFKDAVKSLRNGKSSDETVTR